MCLPCARKLEAHGACDCMMKRRRQVLDIKEDVLLIRSEERISTSEHPNMFRKHLIRPSKQSQMAQCRVQRVKQAADKITQCNTHRNFK